MNARALIDSTAETIPVRPLNPSSDKPPSPDLRAALWNIISRSDTKLDSNQQQAL